MKSYTKLIKILFILALCTGMLPMVVVQANTGAYDFVNNFSEGLALVSKDGKYGYVDKNGKEVISLKYDEPHGGGVWGFYGFTTGFFKEGLALVEKNDKYGYIDKMGKEVIPLKYDSGLDFSEGFARVEKNGKIGYMDKRGKEITSFIYDNEIANFWSSYSFREGLALVQKNGKHGYIDKTGKEVISLKYDNAGDFSEGFAAVGKGDEDNTKWGYIDKTGKEVIPLIYDFAIEFSEGLAWVEKDGKGGFINYKGEQVVPFLYMYYSLEGSKFSEGVAEVRRSEDYLWGYVDKTGTEIIPLMYDEARPFNEGLAMVDKNGKKGYINKARKEVVSLKYGNAGDFSEGFAVVGDSDEENRKFGYIDKTGAEVTPLIYEEAKEFSDGVAWVKQNGKWHIIDQTMVMIADEAIVYQYDEPDVGATIQLDYEKLTEIKNAEDATRIVQEAVQKLVVEQKTSATGRDKVTLYAEEAASRAATQQFDQHEIVVNKELVEELSVIAASAKQLVEQTLKQQGIEQQRDLRTAIRLNVNEVSQQVIISFDASIQQTDAELIHVTAGSAEVAVNVAAMVEELSGNELLTIKIEEVKSASAGTVYKITFNKANLQETVKLSLPPVSGDPIYQTVAIADGNPVTSKYNPATGLMMASITSSGTYTVQQNKKDFSDIQNKPKEMQEAIRYLASKGIINGTSDAKFSPDGSISRAEITALLVRALGKLDANANGGFKDVTRSNWYYGAVGSAKRLGIINGYEDNTFKGNVTIPKVQIIAIAARTLEKEMRYKKPSNTSNYLKYADNSSIADWAKADIAMATRENLIVKRTDNKFVPNNNMTRGDAAIILKRMFDKIW